MTHASWDPIFSLVHAVLLLVCATKCGISYFADGASGEAAEAAGLCVRDRLPAALRRLQRRLLDHAVLPPRRPTKWRQWRRRKTGTS